MSLLSSLRKRVPLPIKQLARSRSATSRLAKVLSPCLPPITCIDVGASYYPHVNWRVFLESPSTQWVAVEPNVKNIAYVDSWAWPCKVETVTTGLSQHGGQQTLYITNTDSGSSLLEPVIADSVAHRIHNLEYFFPLRRQVIDTLTLASVVDQIEARSPTFVKLDTQGTELSILMGAAANIESRQIIGIELEATLLAQPVMKGAGKFWEASRYLEAMGFELVHLKPISGPSRFGARVGRGNTYLNECDAVFSLRRDVVKGLSPQYRVALFAFYLCYRLYEESFSLLEDDRELATLLADRGCELKALSALIRRLA